MVEVAETATISSGTINLCHVDVTKGAKHDRKFDRY